MNRRSRIPGTENPRKRRSFAVRVPSQDGLTLLELTIVLVILITVIAVAWPRLSTRLRKAELRQATVELRELFSIARRSAIANGEIWSFRFRNDKSVFEMSPVRHLRLDADSQAGTSSGVWDPWARLDEAANEPTDDSKILLQRLSGDVVFRSARSAESSNKLIERDAEQNRQMFETLVVGRSDDDGSQAKIGETVYLYPNGRSSQGEFWLLSSDSRFSVKVVVREMTGSLAIGTIQNNHFGSLDKNENANDQNEFGGLTNRTISADTRIQFEGLN